MIDLATFLAIVIIATAVPGAASSALYAWRNRGAADIGLLIILVVGCLLCVWSFLGYLIVVVTLPSPPPALTTNVIILRPLQIFWNLLWTAVPLHLTARSQAIGQGAELHAVRLKNRECANELATANMKLINLERAVEMANETNQNLNQLLEIKTRELEERDGKQQ